MKKFFLSLVLIAACTVSMVLPTGCSRTTLSDDGVYQKDKFLYSAEKTLTTSYKAFDRFVKWEETYREILPVEISRAADTIRLNAKRWLDTGHALRDAYVASPTAENRDKLTLSLNLIDAALAEATKYLVQYERKAPPLDQGTNLPDKK